MKSQDLFVKPQQLKEYLQALGWTFEEEAFKQKSLFVLTAPKRKLQLAFESSQDHRFYKEELQRSLVELSRHLNKDIRSIVEEIRYVEDDVLYLRFYHEQQNITSLTLDDLIQSAEAAKSLIQSAANLVTNPSVHSRGKQRSEVTEMLANTKFRHTEEGSFILKISTPILPKVAVHTAPLLPAMDIEEEQYTPLERKTFVRLMDSVHSIKNQIELGSVDFTRFLTAQLEKDKSPTVSYNMLAALAGLYSKETRNNIELNVYWSKATAGILKVPQIRPIVLPFEVGQQIDEYKDILKATHEERVDVFIGTVEELKGNSNDQGRSGPVRLLVWKDNETFRATVDLDAVQYKKAGQAHMEGNKYIKVEGKLHKRGRDFHITQIGTFELLNGEV